MQLIIGIALAAAASAPHGINPAVPLAVENGDTVRAFGSAVVSRRTTAQSLWMILALRGGTAGVSESPSPVVVGGAVADLLASPTSGTRLILHTSNPGILTVSAGGVGRNIAEGLARLGCNPRFISAVGKDDLGEMVLASLAKLAADGAPICTAGVVEVEGMRTATYSALMDERNDLCAAVADMAVHDAISPAQLAAHEAAIASAPLVVCDANLSPEALVALATLTTKHQVPLWLEPTSVPKGAAAVKALHDAGLLGAVSYTSPNDDEVTAMAAALPDPDATSTGIGVSETGDSIRRFYRRLRAQAAGDNDDALRSAAVKLVRAGIHDVLVTRGARGVLWARGEPEGETLCEEHAAAAVNEVVSTRGAGDAFVGGAVTQLITEARAGRQAHSVASVRAAVGAGLSAARLTVMSEDAVPPELTQASIGLALSTED